MAQKVIVEWVDDLDGTASEDVSTIVFGLEGIEYEIDLTEANANKLRDALDEFVAAARRTGGKRNRRSAASGSAGTARSVVDRDKTKAIRDWARQHGHELAERGRIPSNIVTAYEQAQVDAVEPKPRRSRKKTAETAAG